MARNTLGPLAYTPDPNSGCWLWHGGTSGSGYGQFNGDTAQRLVWVETRGPIPDGAVLRNACGLRLCVNPDHWKLQRGILAR